jgi:hypothetical protein
MVSVEPRAMSTFIELGSGPSRHSINGLDATCNAAQIN